MGASPRTRTRESRTPRAPLACDLRDACDRLRANAAHGWMPAFAMTRAWRGSNKTPSRVAIRQRACCGDTRPKRRNVAARACSASRPRLGEFDADRSLASPDHVDFAETARSIDLQCEGVGHLDIYFHRPHLGAAVGNVEDLAVDHGQYAAGIGPGANVLDLAIFIAAIAVAGKNSPPKFGFIPRARQCLGTISHCRRIARGDLARRLQRVTATVSTSRSPL
jgi:hypothetical protein